MSRRNQCDGGMKNPSIPTTDEILVPAIIKAEIAKARCGNRPTPAQEMESIAKAILAIRYGKAELRELYLKAFRAELRRKKSG